VLARISCVDFAWRANQPLRCPSPFAKIIPFSLEANHFISAAVSSHQEGRLAIVTNAGRDAMDVDALWTNSA
jgi:hypothetical protein